MKKLIAIAVVFALVAGVAFAVDLGGGVQAQANLMKGDSDKDAAGDATPVTGDAHFKQIRVAGSGESGDGKFGGYVRVDLTGDGVFGDYTPGLAGEAWWKPIDQFKLTLGGNPDGKWGKEGVTGWMFSQTAYDSGVTVSENNIWGGGGLYGNGLTTRTAFFRGFGDAGLLLEIKPIDMIGINIALPYWGHADAELKDIFGGLVAQVDLNFDFGNIAISYEGEASYIQDGNVGWAGADGGTIFGYFGGSFGDLSLDVGFGFELPNENEDLKNPFAVGLGLKYAAGAFGVKLRAAASFPTENPDGTEAQPFKVLADVLPYYVINDTTRAFLGAGLGIAAWKDKDAVTGFYLNPWLEVGEEWGPKFLVGFKLWSDGQKTGPTGDDPAIVNWAVPIGILVSF